MAQEEAERRRRERREAGVPEMNGSSSDSDNCDYDKDAAGTAVMRPGAGSSRGDDSREGGPSVNTQHGTRSPRRSVVPSMALLCPFGISFNLTNRYSIGFGPPCNTLLNRDGSPTDAAAQQGML